MRKRFEIQYELGSTPVENVKIPTNSRDELPPILRALQHIYITPELNKQVFDLSRMGGKGNSQRQAQAHRPSRHDAVGDSCLCPE